MHADATIATRPLTDRFGVEVLGLDLARVTASDGYPAIRRLFETRSALLFRDQDLSDADHLRLARLFGPIEDRGADTRGPEEAFAVPEVSNLLPDGSVRTEADLETLHLKANFLWHIDSTFLPVPALTNILIGRTVTETGGETELASTRAAFRDMAPALQDRLRSLVFRHHYAHSRAQISPELAALPRFHKWPATRWRAVLANPATGEEAIYVASHAFAVEGMEEAEGRAFLADLIARCTAPAYVYSHRWRPGDVLIWDQRAVLHRGRPWPFDRPRRLTSLCVSLSEADGLGAMRPPDAA